MAVIIWLMTLEDANPRQLLGPWLVVLLLLHARPINLQEVS